MNQTIADQHLGLRDQALAVLAMLAQREPDFAEWDDEHHEYVYEARTSAWYDCRESGVCLVVHRTLDDRTCLVITFGEHRVADSIFVDHWECQNRFVNPPTVDDKPKAAYNENGREDVGCKMVDYGRVDLAVQHIHEVIGRFLKARKLAADVKKPKEKRK